VSKERGRFISFEGPEGGGKSTHIARLAEALRRRGLEVVMTREPGGTQLAEDIRALLQDVREDAPVPRAEVLLFLASRAQHVAKVIAPALARGAWVLTDRFEDSTFAYQGAGRGFALDGLRRLNDFATGGVRPDLVLVLDVSRQESRARLAVRQAAAGTGADRIEREADAFHERLRGEFLALAAAEPARYAVIDSERPVDEVGRDILGIVEERCGGAG
jgi:dTMP kinase